MAGRPKNLGGDCQWWSGHIPPKIYESAAGRKGQCITDQLPCAVRHWEQRGRRHISCRRSPAHFARAADMNVHFARVQAGCHGQQSQNKPAEAGGDRCGASGADNREGAGRQVRRGCCEVRGAMARACRSALLPPPLSPRSCRRPRTLLPPPLQRHLHLPGRGLPVCLEDRPGPWYGQRPRLRHQAPPGAAQPCSLECWLRWH